MKTNEHIMKTSEVIIIGSGFGGLCAAIQLKASGINDIVILEREHKPGGTWQVNNYPGAAVDVASDLYSFSFEHRNWSQRFAKQEEILQYTLDVIDKHQLRELIVTGANVSKAQYDNDNQRWQVETDTGERYSAPILINAIGHLSQPAIPKINGLDSFKGHAFHTARWDHSVDWRGKKIGVIGTGASAIQVVPTIAPDAEQLHVFQRTPHWMVPRHDKKHGPIRRLLQKIPLANTLARAWIYLKSESRVLAFQYFPTLLNKIAGREARHHLESQVSDLELRAKLTPNYTIGCKRILISNAYYPALCRDNVTLQTEGIDCINETGIRLKNGEQVDLDIIVFATGFAAFTSTDCLPFDIIGPDQQSLREKWQQSARAYVGVGIPEFPNLFYVNGPNTGIGHTSAIFMIESQVNYITDALKYMKQHNAKTVVVTEQAAQNYNHFIQSALKNSVWSTGGCDSWYLNAAGENTSIFPSFTFVFRHKAKRFIPEHHTITYAS